MTNFAQPQPQPWEQDTELHRYLQILWRRKWILVLCLTLIPISAYVVSSLASPTYESSATVQVEPTGAQPAIDAGATARSLATAVRLAETTTVAREASTRLDNPPRDPRDLRDSIQLDTDPEAGFITVTASAGDGQRAADIANAYAEGIKAARTKAVQEQIDVTIDETSSAAREGSGRPSSELQQELEQLKVARAEQANKTQVIEPALRSRAPVSPKPLRTAGLALVLALFIGVGLVLLLEKLDRHIREPEEIERLLGVPLLGVVPASAFPGRQAAGWTQEAFQMLRARLTHFSAAPLETIIITSPVSGDGKTTVVTNLAIAFARAGKRVVLVDADLRHPQVENRLDGNHSAVGLGGLLTGEYEPADVLREVELDGARFKIIPAGPTPPNPSELLASERIRVLLENLRRDADLVLVDTPPVLVVSDAIPLLKEASGVVLVAKLRQTPRKALVQLAAVINNAGGHLLGAVATGASLGSGYGYGYGYGPQERDAGSTSHSSKPQPVKPNSNGEASTHANVAVSSGSRPDAATRAQDS